MGSEGHEYDMDEEALSATGGAYLILKVVISYIFLIFFKSACN